VAALPGQLSALDWSTRGELLRAQRQELAAVEARLLSLGRAAVATVAVVVTVIAVPVGLVVRDELGAPTAGAVVALALVGLATAVLLRHQGQASRLFRELGAWSEVDREPQWRQLPVGYVATELLSVHDARDDARLPEVVLLRLRRAQERVFAGRVFVLGALAGLHLAVAAVAWGGVLLADGEPQMVVAGVAAAAVATVSVVVGWSRLLQLMLRRQRELNRAALEKQVYERRFSVLHGGEVPAPPEQVPLAARVVAPVVGLALVLVLGWRVSTSSGVAVLVAGGLVVAIAAGALAAVLRQRRPHVVSLLAPGGGLLERPDKPVAVSREGGDVVLAGAGETLRIPGHDVVGIEPVRLAFAMAPPAVLVVTPGDPVVVAGRGVDAALSSS
jgi:hypothetical protein